MKKFFRIMALCASLSLCCAGCVFRQGGAGGQGGTGGGNAGGAWSYTDTAMGTVVQQSIYVKGRDAAERVSGEIMEYLGRLEREMLSWRLDTSEVYRVNASAGSGEGYALSGEMASLLQDCLELYRQSEGAFDVTLGPVVRLWNIDQWAAGKQTGDFRAPSRGELDEALELCGSDKIIIMREDAPQPGRESDLTIILPEGMMLDLGAVGKGYALDGIRDILEQEPEITGAVISLGGSVLVYGEKPDERSWRVGIVDPLRPSENIGVLSLKGQWCITTSGDYERYAEADGVRYHHILDPATGFPADGGVRGVTILSKDGEIGDGLSTACFILGAEKGMELAGRYGAEALFVLEDGSIVMSEGMEDYFTYSAGR